MEFHLLGGNPGHGWISRKEEYVHLTSICSLIYKIWVLIYTRSINRCHITQWTHSNNIQPRKLSYNWLINNKGVCRTAPVTPGLLKKGFSVLALCSWTGRLLISWFRPLAESTYKQHIRTLTSQLIDWIILGAHSVKLYTVLVPTVLFVSISVFIGVLLYCNTVYCMLYTLYFIL